MLGLYTIGHRASYSPLYAVVRNEMTDYVLSEVLPSQEPGRIEFSIPNEVITSLIKSGRYNFEHYRLYKFFDENYAGQ